MNVFLGTRHQRIVIIGFITDEYFILFSNTFLEKQCFCWLDTLSVQRLRQIQEDILLHCAVRNNISDREINYFGTCQITSFRRRWKWKNSMTKVFYLRHFFNSKGNRLQLFLYYVNVWSTIVLNALQQWNKRITFVLLTVKECLSL